MPPKVFDDNLSEAISKSKILVVGAGGIGCELLKNLVLTGFSTIEIIDLDTIDVSNLNRQFLFRKEHVGKSKAEVAKESALKFNPNVKIIARHDSIIGREYNSNYMSQFTMVLNALDNRSARNHVNRLCLAANIPLVETGTAGYAGQVEIIKKEIVQCYECQPQKLETSYASCTIRNTPSEPIHCIVWAKHLFNQLFGDEDPDQAVSPDAALLEDKDGKPANNAFTDRGDGNVNRKSTREWANECNYDPEKIFKKLFVEDVDYLLRMEHLWEDRQKPMPLSFIEETDLFKGRTEKDDLSRHNVFTMNENIQVFSDSLKALHKELIAKGGNLVWDKDDKHAMDFVAAAANLRCACFNLKKHSPFEVKAMAGNIIPAIATANAIVAGLALTKALAILRGELPGAAAAVFMRAKRNHHGYMLVPEKLPTPPNPKCSVCSPKPEVTIACNISTLKLNELKVAFQKGLHMTAPDAFVEGAGICVLSSDPGETDDNNEKTLSELKIEDGTALMVDDYVQNYEVRVIITDRPKEESWKIIKGGEEEFMKANNETEPSTSRDDGDIEMVEDETPAKRARLDLDEKV